MKCDATGVNSTADVQGKPMPAPGTYLCVVKECEEDAKNKEGKQLGKNGASRALLGICAGTVPGQEDKEYEHLMWFKDGGTPTDLHLRFALATGMLKPKETRDVNFDSEAPGKLLVVRFVEEDEQKKGDDGKYHSTGKKLIRIGGRPNGLDLWNIADADVKEIVGMPDCQRIIRAVSGGGQAIQQQQQQSQQSPPPAQSVPPQQSQQPQQQPPQQSASPASASSGEWDV